jgi:hypothetical protein
MKAHKTSLAFIFSASFLIAVIIQPIIKGQSYSAFHEGTTGSRDDRSQNSLSPDTSVVDCRDPDVICDALGDIKTPLPLLPCVEKVNVLRNEKGQIEYLSHEDLQKYVLGKVIPEWPVDTPPGYQANVYVVIGTKGKVLCADILDRDEPAMQAALTAALKWRFKPILEKGSPISAIGVLSFETPLKRKYKHGN